MPRTYFESAPYRRPSDAADAFAYAFAGTSRIMREHEAYRWQAAQGTRAAAADFDIIDLTPHAEVVNGQERVVWR